jgi:hypothetical protein
LLFVSTLAISQSLAVAQSQSAIAEPLVFPPDFKGEDCDSLVATLKQNKVRKDEFESSADFTQRLEKLLESKSVTGSTLSEPKYFINSDRTSAVYDADKGAIKVYGSLRQSTKISDSTKYASTVIVKTRSTDTSEYQGQNRFGVATQVTKFRKEICGVAFLNVSPATDHQWMGTIEFPLSAEIARQSKGNIAIAYSVRLATPLLVEHRQHISPTVTSPTEIIVAGDALVATLERFYVFNRATGDVLHERIYAPR